MEGHAEGGHAEAPPSPELAHEHSAFSLLTFLEEHAAPDYHSAGIRGCRADSRTLYSLTARFLPQVHAKLKATGIIAEVRGVGMGVGAGVS